MKLFVVFALLAIAAADDDGADDRSEEQDDEKKTDSTGAQASHYNTVSFRPAGRALHGDDDDDHGYDDDGYDDDGYDDDGYDDDSYGGDGDKVVGDYRAPLVPPIRDAPPPPSVLVPPKPPVLKAPAYGFKTGYVPTKHDYHAVPDYNYAYGIKDKYSGVDVDVFENRLGHQTEGGYSTALPDGRKQVVKYWVDGNSGFNADVKYYGVAKHPPTYSTGGYASGHGYGGGHGPPHFGPRQASGYANNFGYGGIDVGGRLGSGGGCGSRGYGSAFGGGAGYKYPVHDDVYKGHDDDHYDDDDDDDDHYDDDDDDGYDDDDDDDDFKGLRKHSCYYERTRRPSDSYFSKRKTEKLSGGTGPARP